MRMHSLLHLVCASVKGPITGAAVAADKGRVDFDLGETRPDKEALAAQLNALIADDRPLSARWITDDELARQPDLVRTLTVKPPTGSGRVRLIEIAGVDLQPCGGTHVRSTAEIGPVRVVKIENKGRQNRRIVVAFDEA
jgi:misacylated tRNA(Ala) deacylase